MRNKTRASYNQAECLAERAAGERDALGCGTLSAPTLAEKRTPKAAEPLVSWTAAPSGALAALSGFAPLSEFA